MHLHLVDGQRGDSDLEPNSEIITSLLPVQIGLGVPNLEVDPVRGSPSVDVSWPVGHTNPILEKSINLTDWQIVPDESKTIDGRKSLEQALGSDGLFFRLTTSDG